MSLAHSEGWSHRRERQAWAPIVAQGLTACARCGQPIVGLWDLGHPDDRPGGRKLPEHRSCNRAAGARKTNRQRRGWKPPPPRPQVW